MLSTTLFAGLALLGAATTPTQASPLSRRENDVLLKIPRGDGNKTSSTQYGFMFEDINNSGDGGLYAELLSNRALQIVDVANQTTALYTWSAVNGSALSAVNDTEPVSAALPNSFKLDLTGGQGSFENEGYWGIKVDSEWTYNVSFWAKSASPANVTIELVSNSTGSLGSASFPALTSEWAEYTTTLKPSQSAADVHNTFRVSVNGDADASVYFALFSLFPPTYKGRANGMRIDLAETLAAVEPSIWRFPGGNNLEGQTPDTRWRWNATIGPLSERPGRMGDWSYQNTDGLGLLEYLHWLEDLDVDGIMGVYAGYSLQGIAVNEGSAFDWVVQEALDQIDFVLGDAATSPMAKLRADLGHPEPFTRVKYIEIGNEDFFAEESYQAYRWPRLQKAISEKYPDLPLMATTRPFTDNVPREDYSDRHVYQTPSWFHQQAGRYDNAPRPPYGPMIFEGEYAAISMNSSDLYAPVSENVGRLEFSTLMSACGEASYAIGFERNADLVFASAYAPLLENHNRAQWTPNLIVFDAGEVYPSVSYYVQKMFSTHRSEVILPVDIANGSTPYALNYVAGVNYERSLLFIKASNFGDDTIPLALEIGADWNSKNATVEILKADNATAWNKPNIENKVEPEMASVELYNNKLSYEMPPYSVAVFSVAF